MIKNIKYSGYTAQPSDYESPDGDLATSLNLIPENGALTPIPPPKKILQIADGERILLLHTVPGRTNYIILRQALNNSFTLWWLQKNKKITDTSSATQIGRNTYLGFKDIAIVGNTIIMATCEGIKYALWKDDHYINLNGKPPFVSINFGMYKIASLSDSDKFDIPARCSTGWDATRSQAENEELKQFSQMAYGLLLKNISEQITSNGYFYMPFFVRYAFRLYDGSYSWHSAPILMLPTILPPFIKYSDNGANAAADSTVSATMTLNVPYFGLAYRILADGLNELDDWADIVSGIDVFISAPIYTYDQSKNVPWRPVTDTYTILSRVSNDRVWKEPDGKRPHWALADEVFVGHYADTINDKFVDHTMKTASHDNPDNYDCVNIQCNSNFHRNIESEHTFYKIAELDIKDIKAMTQMERLPLKDKDMSALVTRPTLPDDYQSHCLLSPSSLFAYNSRLNLAGLQITPAEPFPLPSIMQFGNPDGSIVDNARITVWSRINGIRCFSRHSSHPGFAADIWNSPANNFPRYIYYPDASAYKMEIYISDTQKYIINLKPHDFLNGAYWYRGIDGMNKVSTPPANTEEESTQFPTTVSIAAKIYTSEVNNPFLFPVTLINTVGSGTIFALSSAVKALSQGQFGQFPLYAFSSEGVWALEVSSTGGFISRQPVTRDVCRNPDSITQIDSAVLFASDRGIMLIQGSDTVCISDSINANSVSSLSDMPLAEETLALTNFDASDIDIMPFADFLAHCRMVYDYPHQRIIIYHPETNYAYVYSLKSKLWGMMQSNLSQTVLSYPEALAISSEKNPEQIASSSLVDFSLSDVSSVSGIILSRPLKLDNPDILKTIDTVIQRGYFRKGHVQSVLYGSRDLFNWHLVWSSKDHSLRGFRGTPYKYFRIALICNLDIDETIAGCSVKFSPRLTNQPR